MNYCALADCVTVYIYSSYIFIRFWGTENAENDNNAPTIANPSVNISQKLVLL